MYEVFLRDIDAWMMYLVLCMVDVLSVVHDIVQVLMVYVICVVHG
jgi:hypothetical protein